MGLEDRGTTSRQANLEIEVFVVVIAWKVYPVYRPVV